MADFKNRSKLDVLISGKYAVLYLSIPDLKSGTKTHELNLPKKKEKIIKHNICSPFGLLITPERMSMYYTNYYRIIFRVNRVNKPYHLLTGIRFCTSDV